MNVPTHTTPRRPILHRLRASLLPRRQDRHGPFSPGRARRSASLAVALVWTACGGPAPDATRHPLSACDTPLPRRLSLFRFGHQDLARILGPAAADLRGARSEAPDRVEIIGSRLVAHAPGDAEVALRWADCAHSLSVDVWPASAFGARVRNVNIGPGGGFGSHRLPEVVLGPPRGAGEGLGGTDVVSLGRGGHIELAFDVWGFDGPGADLLVFENAFRVAGATTAFEERGAVELMWGDTSHSIECSKRGDGCAGRTPVYGRWPPAPEVDPATPDEAGGDAFDLGDSLPGIDALRIYDQSEDDGVAPTHGFDLDAVAIVHALPRDTERLSWSEPSPTLVVDRPVAPPLVDAVRPSGQRFVGINAVLSATPADILRIEADRIVPLRPGIATLTASAGPFVTHIELEVMP